MTHRPPKYFGKYRNARDLLSAVKDQHELFFSRDTTRFFRSSKYWIENWDTGEIVLACQNTRPTFSRLRPEERAPYVARYRIEMEEGGALKINYMQGKDS